VKGGGLLLYGSTISADVDQRMKVALLGGWLGETFVNDVSIFNQSIQILNRHCKSIDCWFWSRLWCWNGMERKDRDGLSKVNHRLRIETGQQQIWLFHYIPLVT
jgi:hypothetical protein